MTLGKEAEVPGAKMKSIKRPRTYEKLVRGGTPKTQVAKIANAQAKKAKKKRAR